jgi:hypothetical protein
MSPLFGLVAMLFDVRAVLLMPLAMVLCLGELKR